MSFIILYLSYIDLNQFILKLHTLWTIRVLSCGRTMTLGQEDSEVFCVWYMLGGGRGDKQDDRAGQSAGKRSGFRERALGGSG